MPPTIDEDLARLEARLIERCQCGGCRSDREALTRIRAALADAPKLRVGQRVRSKETGHELVIETVHPAEYTVCDGPTYAADDLEPVEAERLRQSGKAGA